MSVTLRPYPEYRDSQLPWAGKLPQHWKSERAKWLFERKQRLVRNDDEVVTCFRDGTVTLRKKRRLQGFTESLKEIGYQGVRRGDLVIHAMDAFAGAVGVSDSNGKCTPVYAVCEVRNNCDAFYYAYVIRVMARSQYITALARGIRERSTDFRFEELAAQRLPLPPAEEQAAISAFLKQIERGTNALIRSKRREIELLKERKQATINRAVIRGIKPHARLKPSGIPWLGEIPEHWRVSHVRVISQVVRGSSPRPAASPLYFHGNSEPWITVGELTKDSQVYLYRTSTKLTDLGVQHSRVIEPGTLLLTNSGATLGVPKISLIRGCINDGVAAFRRLHGDIEKEYLYFYWTTQTAHLRAWVDLGAQPNLNTQIIGGWPVPIPPRSEQLDIVNCIRARTAGEDSSIDVVEREIGLIHEYRTRLITDVVTGKLDLRGVEVPELDFEGAAEPLDAEPTDDLEMIEEEETVAAEEGDESDD